MKSLREHLTEVATQCGDEPTDEVLFEILVECNHEVCKDDEDEHRWYINWRHVFKVTIDGYERYFAMVIPHMKTESGCRSDVGFEENVDNAWEVFPRTVSKVVYE